MRVTFVLPHAGLQGGVRVVAIYAEQLKRRGHEVFVISTPRRISIRERMKSFAMGGGWPPSGQEAFVISGQVGLESAGST